MNHFSCKHKNGMGDVTAKNELNQSGVLLVIGFGLTLSVNLI